MTLAAFIERSEREKEDWKYTDLKGLLNKRASLSLSPTLAPKPASDTRLVFRNGTYEAKASRFASAPSCLLMGDRDSGYKITIGEETCLVAQPVELVFVADEHAPEEINIALSIEIGKSGRLTLMENHAASKTPTTMQMDISLAPKAKFLHAKLVEGGTHLAMQKVQAQSGAYYNNFSILRGALPIRNEIDVSLEGEEAQAGLNGIMLLNGSEHADTTTRVTHRAPKCASRQSYRTILRGQSRGVFQGKITVAEGAQKSDGYQSSRALLLSDQAEMDAQPELEIYADDVKCSHGNTIGDLDQDALFYLRSRGLNEDEARRLLIEGFLSEMLDDIPVEDWRAIFRREIEKGLK